MAAQNEEEERRAAAASVIQAKFRENASRTKDKGLEQSQEEKTTKASDAGVEKQRHNELDSDKRWDDALNRTKLQRLGAAASSNASNTPQDRWQRAGLFTTQITQAQSDAPAGAGASDAGQATGSGTTADSNDGNVFKNKLQAAKAYAQYRDPETGKRRPFNGNKDGQKAVKIKKNLEEQHWLELIDTKHRYGSNIKYYFEEWQASDEAQGNFFYWLDHGKGKELSLPKCPREKLESECINYLSVEQRRHYLVTIDKESGRLRWEHPSPRVVKHTGDQHPLVETTGRKWMDLGKGKGVAPVEIVPEEIKKDAYTTNFNSGSSSSLSYSSDSSGSTPSAGSEKASADGNPEPQLVRRTSSTSFVGQDDSKGKEKEKGDVWIYVSDSEYRLYLGIKQKGRFQHSSFLAGGPITSAGTLVVKEGQLVKCNPMSGHYRTKAVYFKRWIDEMEKQGADLSQVKIKGTELKLWFIEQANKAHTVKGKTRRLKKAFEKKMHI